MVSTSMAAEEYKQSHCHQIGTCWPPRFKKVGQSVRNMLSAGAVAAGSALPVR